MTEPWRLACPHNHRTVRRVGGQSIHTADSDRRWSCDGCKANDAIDGYHYESVTDLKTGAEVSP